MTTDTRHKDTNWDLSNINWQQVPIAVLMDIRDELRRLNAFLDCTQFRAIPRELRKIRTNTTKKTRSNGGRA